MEPNRTSSFPAETKNKGGLNRFDYQVLLGFTFMIFVMACASAWVYAERSAVFGVFLAACTAGESATMVLYYRNAKRRSQPTAGT
jgi:hypothetical protein